MIQVRGRHQMIRSIKILYQALDEGSVQIFPVADGVRFWEESKEKFDPSARVSGTLGLLLSEGLIPGLMIVLVSLVSYIL